MKGWPKRVKLCSRFWNIEYVPKTHPELNIENDDEEDYYLGSCNKATHTIHIEDSQSPESMKDTLVHEMFHAVYATQPGMAHHDEDAEENTVLFATEAFFEIVRNLKPFWEA